MTLVERAQSRQARHDSSLVTSPKLFITAPNESDPDGPAEDQAPVDITASVVLF